MFVAVHTGVWRPEVTLDVVPKVNSHSPYFCDRVTCWDLGLTSLVRLAGQQTSEILWCLLSQLWDWAHKAMHAFYMGAGDGSQIFMLARQALH